ncbi:MAG: hypothetical protein GC153_01370 [Alphaproteobacteria bacterium]|nr:hypothetical protein [Alphaproteobacteria bacterium]
MMTGGRNQPGADVTGRADIGDKAFGALAQRLRPAASASSDPASPLFNLTKSVAKFVIVGAILVYALWPERALLFHMLSPPAAPAALTDN